MNCYFVSCEIAENPDLKGKKVAVAPHVHDRKGIILAASYEARPYGVHSAMRVSDALIKCPDLILVEPNMELYGEYSRTFFDYFLSITPLVEPASIDEGYMDVTDVCEPDKIMDLARRIQDDLLNIYGLPCSIGIAPNKFLAKMASDMKKPLGITVLRKREIDKLLWPLPIEEMYGVGRRGLDNFKALGIKTIGDLANYKDLKLLNEVLGSTNAEGLYSHANGNGSNDVDANRFTDIASISNSQTLEFDEYKIENMLLVIKILNNVVSGRLEKSNLKASTITLQIRYNNFKTITRSRTIDKPTNDSVVMYRVLKDLFDDYYDPDYPVRLLGVAAGKLVEAKDDIKQLSIFDKLDEEAKEHEVLNIIGNINSLYGQSVLKKGVPETKKEEKTSKYDRRWAKDLKDLRK